MYKLNVQKIVFPAVLAFSLNANASIESSMYAFRSQLSGVFLPALALVGIVIAGISLAFGHQNAKNHITMAVLGSVIGFGADSIIEFVRRTFGSV
jgi:type IV secretory pathway VirB2 component (pilin)